jgi:MoaA/NifB/PqqE/SkfB family radical SAM enzyme
LSQASLRGAALLDTRRAALRRRLRAWHNIARSATKRRVDPDWIPRPHVAHLITTYRCNLKCIGCPSWEVKEHQDLTTEEWLSVFRQLWSLDVVKVLGGEPFVRKDIVQLLSGVREIIDPYILQVTTNGMLTKRVIEAIEAIAWPGLQLRISVDGLEGTHDRIRGVEGSRRIVERTVRQVGELKDKYGFKFGINFALTDDSIPELDAMLRFAEEVGADLIPGVNVDPFLIGTSPPEIGPPQRVIMVSDPELAYATLADSRVGTKQELPLIDHLFSRFITKQVYGYQLHEEGLEFPCRELRDLLYLLPNGDVVRCGMDHRPVGSLRESTFDEIWFGSAIQAWRDKVDACPGCMQTSVQILSRLYGGCITA